MIRILSNVSKPACSIKSQHMCRGNNKFERVEHFTCLGTSLMNQNSIHEEIKCRLQAGNACYYLLQNLLSSSLLSKNKNIKVKIYRTIILPFVFPMKLVSFLAVQEILLWSVCICCQRVVYLPVSQDFF
jgi:hypothetical protein